MTSPSADDAGFTLIEILIATMITSIVLTVLVASFLVFFQNAAYTSGRDDHAAGAEALSAWLDRDLASATGDTPPVVTPASSCTGSPVVLSLSWTQYVAGALANSFPSKTGATYRADYRFAPDSLNPGRCMITRTLVGPTTSTLELMRDLIGSSLASQSNLTVSTTATASCQPPDNAVTVKLMQYHSSTASDSAIPYTYFGCVNARTNALPTPTP